MSATKLDKLYPIGGLFVYDQRRAVHDMNADFDVDLNAYNEDTGTALVVVSAVDNTDDTLDVELFETWYPQWINPEFLTKYTPADTLEVDAWVRTPSGLGYVVDVNEYTVEVQGALDTPAYLVNHEDVTILTEE